MSAFPYNLNTLLGGAARVLYAPITETIPDDPADIFDQTDPYAVNGNWKDFGATRESFTYSSGLEKGGSEIQQEQGLVLEEVTSITRTATVSVANISKDTFAIIENAATTGTVAASSGVNRPYDEVPMGSFTEVQRYRFAFVAKRHQAAGVVDEGALDRGRFVVALAKIVEISADERSLELAKGELTAVPVTFNFFPDDAASTGEEYGFWWFEQAGAIT